MARSRRISYPTPDELIATIARSSFPSIVTEGDDDVIVLRRLEDEFAETGLTLLPAGGREAVLEVFERRHTLPARARVFFIADRDLWVISGVPVQYQAPDLIFTSGYSIENDMYMDGDLELLLTRSEHRIFQRELEIVCRWYALALNRCFEGLGENISIHPNELLGDPDRAVALNELKDFEQYPEALRQRIFNDYARLLRGKTLFALLTRQSTGHHSRMLLDFGASRRGPLFHAIINNIRRNLARL